MSRKTIATLLAVVMILGAFAGCTPSDPGTTQAGTTATPGTTSGSGATTTQVQQQSSAFTPVKDFVNYQTIANEMETFVIQYSQSAKELDVLTNCIEGLLSNDNYGALVPAVATDWNSPDGGLTWTFNLRESVWVDYKGNIMANVVAEDFLWGLEWTQNFWKNESNNTSMPNEMIKGALDYNVWTKGYEADDADGKAAFEAVCDQYGLDKTPLTEAEAKALGLETFLKMVGISAPDDYTLNFECTAQLPYFPTLACYNCLYPISGELLAQMDTDSYRAVKYDQLWYNGCYTMTTYVQNNEKVYTRNPHYWDTDCLLFDTVTTKMVESTDVAFQMYTAGELDYVQLTESNLQTIYNNPSHQFHDYLTEARPTKYSYQFYYNFAKNKEDGTPDVNWNTAVANEAFRLAWYYGLDTATYLRRVNAINPIKCDNYAITARNLSVTSNGTDYTKLVEDLLGITPSDERIARIDTAKFAQYKAQAMEELAAKGVTFPVVCDYYIIASNQTSLDSATVLKQTFSDTLGDDFVVLNIKTYISSVAQEVRNPSLHSLYLSGWGADYGDPLNFLSQLAHDYDNAYHSIQFTKINEATDPDLLNISKTYTDMVWEADKIKDNNDKRFAAFAAAEAYYIEHGMIIPVYYNIVWQLTRANDFTKIYATYGIQNNKYKNWETSVDGFTTADFAAFAEAYNSK